MTYFSRHGSWLALVVLLAPLGGCGARTITSEDEGAPGDSAVVDSGIDTFVPFDSTPPPIDTRPPPIDTRPTGCLSDLECNDSVACTDDHCDFTTGTCTHTPLDIRCDDGIWCNGDEKCDVTLGCQKTPRTCADSVACTADRCDEAGKKCVNTPDDKLCPISHGCDPTLGCQARAFAHSDTTLFEVKLPSGTVNKIGITSGVLLSDIALHPSGTLYGVSYYGFWTVDTSTGAVASVAPLGGFVGLNALDTAPDGTVYGAGGSSIYTVDRTTALAKIFATFPTGFVSSGDIAFLSGRLLATANNGSASSPDTLIEFDVSTKKGTPLGPTGFRCVWGLAAFGPTLYGLTCEGRVLSIDPKSGNAKELVKTSETFYGASAR